MRARCSSVSERLAPTSKLASTRDAVTFACCPPGPDERLVRSSTSDSGIATPGLISSIVGHAQQLPMGFVVTSACRGG